jgi:hypothetical protein
MRDFLARYEVEAMIVFAAITLWIVLALAMSACCHAFDPKRLIGECQCPCFDDVDAGSP